MYVQWNQALHVKSNLAKLFCAFALLAIQSVYAGEPSVITFTPQGKLSELQQVRASFSESMHALGVSNAPTPFDIDCPADGKGNWVDDRTWVWNVKRSRTFGELCTFTLKPETMTLGRKKISGKRVFQFNLPNLSVQQDIASFFPQPNTVIREDQVFTLQFTEDVRQIPPTLYCQQEGLGKIRVVRLSVEELKAQNVFQPDESDNRSMVVRCEHTLLAGKGMSLIQESKGELAREIQFKVRQNPLAWLSCTPLPKSEECSPDMPLVLGFNTKLDENVLRQIHLEIDGREASGAPRINYDYLNGPTSEVVFEAQGVGNNAAKILFPENLKDLDGRPFDRAVLPSARQLGTSFPFAVFLGNAVTKLRPVPKASVNLLARYTTVGPSLQELVLGPDSDTVTSDQIWIKWLQTFGRYATHPLGGGRDAKTEYIDAPMFSKADSAVNTIWLAKSDPEGRIKQGEFNIPINGKGLHLLDVESGSYADYLTSTHDRSAVLVSDLAIHVKHVSDMTQFWVTTLGTGEPVPGAHLTMYSCLGELIWEGHTDGNGIATASSEAWSTPKCDRDAYSGRYVFAHQRDASGKSDMSVVQVDDVSRINTRHSGIERSLRFDNLLRIHTVLDRMLFHPGETVSIRNIARLDTKDGLGIPESQNLPIKMTISGGERKWEQTVTWNAQGESFFQFVLPKDAPLDQYEIEFESESKSRYHLDDWYTGGFKVAAFRIPELTGSISLGEAPLGFNQSPKLQIELHHANGGAAAGLKVYVRAHSSWNPRRPSFPKGYRYRDFLQQQDWHADEPIELFKRSIVLDAGGKAQLDLPPMPSKSSSYGLVVEVSYADTNGEQQSLTQSFPVWDKKIVVGVATQGIPEVGQAMHLNGIVADTSGKVLVGQNVLVKLTHFAESSNFYRDKERAKTIENATSTMVCEGRTDQTGQFHCPYVFKEAGSYLVRVLMADQLPIATASMLVQVDAPNATNRTVFVKADRTQYKVGDTAHLQVVSPFKRAKAWLTVEREGIYESRIVDLKQGTNTVDVRIGDAYSPDVFVSLLAVSPAASSSDPAAISEVASGTVRLGVDTRNRELNVSVKTEQPTYAPRQHVKTKVVVTMPDGAGLPNNVSLSFVAVDASLLDLMDNTSWQVLNSLIRERFYSVQTFSSLIEQIPPNPLQQQKTELSKVVAMLREAYSDFVVFGKKGAAQRRTRALNHTTSRAVEVSGGGSVQNDPRSMRVEVTGSNITEENMDAPTLSEPLKQDQTPIALVRRQFDSLVLWQAQVPVNAKGEAELDVPLNDSLTNVRLVAIASAGSHYFGSGFATISVSQDVQLTSALPPKVRQGDHLQTGVSLRNASNAEAKFLVTANASGLPAFKQQTVVVGAGDTQRVNWTLDVPNISKALTWTFTATKMGDRASGDRIEVQQQVEPALPVTIQAGSLDQLSSKMQTPIGVDSNSLPGSAMVRVQLQASLAGNLPNVQQWFDRYPYRCLEQQSAIALGTHDKSKWSKLMQDLPQYMSNKGMLSYFPVGDGTGSSDVLTSHLLSLAHDYGWEIPDQHKEKMLDALASFVDGNLRIDHWAPLDDSRARELAAMAALARYKRIDERSLKRLKLDVNLASTSMLIDYLTILKHRPKVPKGDTLQAEVENNLRARLSYVGRRLVLSNDREKSWWWMMGNGDVDSARLYLAVKDLPSWKEDLPRILNGLLGRQDHGAWATTTANVWGTLAVDRFGESFEKTPVSGTTNIALGAQKREIDWASQGKKQADFAEFALSSNNGQLEVEHHGEGKPWVSTLVYAATPLKQARSVGYTISRRVEPVQQRVPGHYSVGDVLRVHLEIDAQADMTWVVVDDPVPSGASLLGTGLGHDLHSADQHNGGKWKSNNLWPEYEARDFTAFRSYYRFVPRGKFSVEYTMRLNDVGTFKLPPTRVEGMYAPEVFGALPNAAIEIRE